MTYPVPNPPVRPAGTRLTGDVYSADVTETGQFLANPPIFKSNQSGAQSIPDSTITAIALNNESKDTYNGHSNVTNNSRYTAQRAGTYMVVMSYAAVANAAGIRLTRIHKNGSYVPPSQEAVATAGVAIDTNIQVTAFIDLLVGDYVEGVAYQTSGGALNTTPGDTGMSVLWVHV